MYWLFLKEILEDICIFYKFAQIVESSSHGIIDLVLLEYSGLSARRASKAKNRWNLVYAISQIIILTSIKTDIFSIENSI